MQHCDMSPMIVPLEKDVARAFCTSLIYSQRTVTNHYLVKRNPFQFRGNAFILSVRHNRRLDYSV